MKVKIGETYYDTNSEPVMLILSDREKEDIRSMIDKKHTKFCKGPSGYGDEAFRTFMDLTPEENERFTDNIRKDLEEIS